MYAALRLECLKCLLILRTRAKRLKEMQNMPTANTRMQYCALKRKYTSTWYTFMDL